VWNRKCFYTARNNKANKKCKIMEITIGTEKVNGLFETVESTDATMKEAEEVSSTTLQLAK
jgi:hypothetical protein